MNAWFETCQTDQRKTIVCAHYIQLGQLLAVVQLFQKEQICNISCTYKDLIERPSQAVICHQLLINFLVFFFCIWGNFLLLLRGKMNSRIACKSVALQAFKKLHIALYLKGLIYAHDSLSYCKCQKSSFCYPVSICCTVTSLSSSQTSQWSGWVNYLMQQTVTAYKYCGHQCVGGCAVLNILFCVKAGL